MELLLQRSKPTGHSLPGELFVDGAHECFSLERDPTDPDHKPIPAGRYPVHMRLSYHFNRLLPHIDDVPGRTDIMIHNGNWASQSEGCVLVGRKAGRDMVIESLAALDALLPKIQEPCWITVQDGVPDAA